MIFRSTLNVVKKNASVHALRKKHTLPDLPYDYNALEPYISADIMKIHHSKHHATYVNMLNQFEEKQHDFLDKNDLTGQLSIQQNLKFNGGGHINHSIFWTNLAPAKKDGGGEPSGAIAEQINKQFGSFNDFKTKFNTAAAGVQGSGWAWLGYNTTAKRVEIVTLPNQDPLTTHIPLLGIDVWEHAYYLQYKNVRPDYLKAIWEVVNWKNVALRASKAGIQ